MKRSYPTSSVNGGSDGPIFQIDQLPNIIDIRVSPVGEPEPVPLEPDPILDRFLHRQLLVRHIRVPRQILTRGPPKRVFVPVRGGYPAFQELRFGRAVSLPVD